MSVAIRAENISKAYQLGEFSTGTISKDIDRWWKLMRGKEDPYLKIGETNDRTSKGMSDIVWSLKDINFEINKGDAVGIIGRNGAGKSTLLKVLSRVTTPTKGNIKVKGRIASLLEVGTGFHPELTGRENIYLNGAILGMRKHEITRKFDEIVDFSGVERYIDTPVKRYSSGMYVRLAFAVAAHLESEILIVDEVLAVGDAEFQKKCLGKMGDVSKGEGRTILFVSHNMAAIETLCKKGILLQNGCISRIGSAKDVVNYYFDFGTNINRYFNSIDSKIFKGNEFVEIIYASVDNASGNTVKDFLDVKSEIDICFGIENKTNESIISVGFDLITIKGDIIFGTIQKFSTNIDKLTELKCRIPSNFLNDDIYTIHIYIHNENMNMIWEEKEFLSFEVKDIERETGYLGKVNGYIRTNLVWMIKN